MFARWHRYDVRIEYPISLEDFATAFQSYLAQDDDDLSDQVRADYPDRFGYHVLHVHEDVITLEVRA